MKGWKAILLVLLGVVISVGLGLSALYLYRARQASSVVSEGGLDHKDGVPYQTMVLKTTLSDKPYVNNEERYSIRFPKDWKIDASRKLGNAVFALGMEYSANDGTFFRPSIGIQTGLTQGHLLSGYKQYYLKDIRQNLKDFNILKERSLILVGRDAVLWDVSFSQDGRKMKGQILLMVGTDAAYVVTAMDYAGHWVEVESDMETSLYTFNLL